MFLRKGVLKICSKFAEQHPCRSAISIGCSPVNFQHIFRTPFRKNISGGLLLSFLTFSKNKQKLDISDKYFNDCDWMEVIEKN